MAVLARVFHDKKPSERDELLELIRTRSFKRGKFKLSSGVESSLYFNMKPTMMHPRGAELAAKEFLKLAGELDIEYIGGLEMGAVPLIGAIAAISSAEGRPLKTFFVRKQPKEHGTRALIEGLSESETLEGRNVLIIDDVATSGKSILKAIEAARLNGANVQYAASLVDREEGGTDLLKEKDVVLRSIFNATEVIGSN